MATYCFCSGPLNLSFKSPPLSSSTNGFLGTPTPKNIRNVRGKGCKDHGRATGTRSRTSSTCGFVIRCGLFPVDPWAPSIDSQSIASQLFAASLFPYLGFLYYITKSKTAPRLTLVGFYFLLAFVGATIPAGIYAKVHYGTSLANVDWLHGGAESLLTITNLLVVLGLREGLRKIKSAKDMPLAVSETKDQSSV